jgi:dCMP deaminase
VTGACTRPIYDWDETHMKAALMYADEHSKCAAKKVACLLVKSGAIISIGINGTSPGSKNCNDLFRKVGDEWQKRVYVTEYVNNENFIDPQPVENPVGWLRAGDQREHYNWSLLNEIHAEANAIGKCAKQGISTEGATAYITHSPCHDCAKLLAVSGIKTVFYGEEFDNVKEVAKVLGKFGIDIYQLEVI